MATIYDHHGRPVKLSALRKTNAAPKTTGVRRPTFESVVTGMTPERMATILMDSAGGDFEEYITLAEEMEERDLHYRSVLTTRKHAVTGLEITVEAKSDSVEDVNLADTVREQIVEHEDFLDMLHDAMDALGKGFSAVEIDWETSKTGWFPRGYTWRDQRFFMLDRETLSELRIRDEQDAFNGLPLPPYKFIVHQPALKNGLMIRGGLARLVAVAYMCKGFALKDWLAFLEVFGMPVRLGKYSPAATEEDRELLASAVANLASDAGAVIPDNMMIEFMESGGGKSVNSDAIFSGLAEYLDKQVSKAVLGQTMTTDDGASLSQAAVHNDVRLDLLRHDARQLSKTINRHLLRPFIDLNFGPRPLAEYPRIVIVYNEPEDLKAFTEAALPWVHAGLTVEASVIRDKFGLPEPESDAEVLGAAPPANEPREEPAQNTKALNGRRKDNIEQIITDLNSDWVDITDTTYAPLFKAVSAAKSFDDLESKLESLSLNTDDFVRHLATQMFKARGLGDVTDEH